MTCRECKYFDEEETWGSKGYCEYDRSYVRENDDACRHFERGSRMRVSGRNVRMVCSKCLDYDPKETWGSKGYCNNTRSYVRPDDDACSRFNP